LKWILTIYYQYFNRKSHTLKGNPFRNKKFGFQTSIFRFMPFGRCPFFGDKNSGKVVPDTE
jgi:hypothetical protein